MGMIGKGFGIVLGVTVAAGAVMGVFRHADKVSGSVSGASPEDRCADRIGSRLPSGAFIVIHTPATLDGRSEWLIDHGGLREKIACTAMPDGKLVLTAIGSR